MKKQDYDIISNYKSAIPAKKIVESDLGYAIVYEGTYADYSKFLKQEYDRVCNLRNNRIKLSKFETTIAERLMAKRTVKILDALGEAFSWLKQYNDGYRVELKEIQYAGFHVSDYADWNYYSKRYGHPKIFKTGNIVLPSYVLSINKKYLLIDGIMNTKIYHKREFAGITVLHVQTLRKTKGERDFDLVDCYIAINGDYSYHADSVKKSISGLKRKINIATAKSEPLSLQSYITRKKYHELTGACMQGIQEFCENNGISDLRKMTIGALLDLCESTGQNPFGLEKIKKVVKI